MYRESCGGKTCFPDHSDHKELRESKNVKLAGDCQLTGRGAMVRSIRSRLTKPISDHFVARISEPVLS
ncbi:hypothetical protein J6590_088617 [Homalodisca vitripennis]|nr:hypothetical protein J6590_088617 [Homalodisca vitripennis]